MEMASLISALTDKYAPAKVSSMTCIEFCKELIADGLIRSESDFNLLVLETIQKALIDDDEFPIHYYTKDEPMSESGRSVGNIECLTDDYIANMLENI